MSCFPQFYPNMGNMNGTTIDDVEKFLKIMKTMKEEEKKEEEKKKQHSPKKGPFSFLQIYFLLIIAFPFIAMAHSWMTIVFTQKYVAAMQALFK